MFRVRGTEAVAAAALTLAVTSALLFGATAHSLIPHNHEGGESIWQQLHASLSHTEKKSLAAVGLSILVSVSIALTLFFVPLTALAPIPNDTRLLHRGIHKSRKFR